MLFLPSGLVCNRTFDDYACWPDGFPNTTVSVECPWYLPWYHKGQSFKYVVWKKLIISIRNRQLSVMMRFFVYSPSLCVFLHIVQHGMVYQDCDANGQWVTKYNTTECEIHSTNQVRKICKHNYFKRYKDNTNII